MYSAKEVGYIALQCPERDVYHVQSENVLVEIVDEDNRPCAPGQAGRVLLTALHKFAMPLIRYEIGDYAVPGEACTCGRGLPTIREIRGRERNMMHLPNGEKRWPLCDLVKEPDLPGIRQYQFVQKRLDCIEVHLVVGPQYSRDMEPALKAAIHRRLGNTFVLGIVYRENISRGTSGKYEDFRCEFAE
jgi:phenylacetate-CoA ligase